MTAPNTPQELPVVAWADEYVATVSAAEAAHRPHLKALVDAATARAEIDKRDQEIAQISAAIGTTDYLDPPDGGSVSLAEQVRRMRAEVLMLRATPTAPADLVEALRDAIRVLREFDSGDPECEHGMFYYVCPNAECEKRNFHQVLESAKSALSRYEAAQQWKRTCTDERMCINCFANQGECLGPYKQLEPKERETDGGA